MFALSVFVYFFVVLFLVIVCFCFISLFFYFYYFPSLHFFLVYLRLRCLFTDLSQSSLPPSGGFVCVFLICCAWAVRNRINGQVAITEASRPLFSTNVDVEPLTGKAMYYRQRLQANYALVQEDYSRHGALFVQGGKADRIFVPGFWNELAAEISDEDAGKFKDKIYGSRKLAKDLQISLLVLGSLFLLLGESCCSLSM